MGFGIDIRKERAEMSPETAYSSPLPSPFSF